MSPKRILIISLAAAAGCFSVLHSAAMVISKANPSAAYRLMPYDGRIAAEAAWEGFSLNPQHSSKSKPYRLAIDALKMDATSVKAVNVLATHAQLKGQGARAEQLFGFSAALSRRELAPQLWEIKDSVARGDIKRALINFDLALRTSKSARRLLFPVLAGALKEPRIRTELIELLKRQPEWASLFIPSLPGSRDVKPVDVAAFYTEASREGFPIEASLRNRTVDALVAKGYLVEGWKYYASMRSGVSPSHSRDPNFQFTEERPSLFDWKFPENSGVFTSVVRDNGGNFVDFQVSPSHRGVAMVQRQVLPSGVYTLSGTIRDVGQSAGLEPFWVLACEQGQELGRVSIPTPTHGISSFNGEFTVPDGCPLQSLSFVLPMQDRIAGLSGAVTRVVLEPKVQ